MGQKETSSHPSAAPGSNASSSAAGTRAAASVTWRTRGVRLVFFIVIALLAGMVSGGAAVYFLLNEQATQKFGQMAMQHRQDLSKTHTELVQAQAQLDTLQARWLIEDSTRKGLEETLHTVQEELGKARDQLAFFDQLMPPGPKGTMSVRAFDIERLGSQLSYRVLLMREATSETHFKGRLQFIATGVRDGKKTKIPLEATIPASNPQPTAAVSDANGFALSFDQFQRSAGLLSLPDDFTPQTVTLNVLEGSTVRVSRTVNLPALE